MEKWREIKEKLEEETAKIKLEPPLELKKLYAGILPYDAGTAGQYFGAMVFLTGTMIFYLGGHALSSGMYKFLRDPSFSLDQCKKIFLLQGRAANVRTVGMVGLQTFYKLSNQVMSSLDELKTKEEMLELMIAYQNYATKLASWCHILFPWNLGSTAFRKKTPEEITELARLYSEAAKNL